MAPTRRHNVSGPNNAVHQRIEERRVQKEFTILEQRLRVRHVCDFQEDPHATISHATQTKGGNDLSFNYLSSINKP